MFSRDVLPLHQAMRTEQKSAGKAGRRGRDTRSVPSAGSGQGRLGRVAWGSQNRGSIYRGSSSARFNERNL